MAPPGVVEVKEITLEKQKYSLRIDLSFPWGKGWTLRIEDEGDEEGRRNPLTRDGIRPNR